MQTSTLTTAPDTIPGLIGSKGTADNSGDDTINGYIDGGVGAVQTFTAADIIDGGTGDDTLNVLVTGAATTIPAASLLNIEHIKVRATVALNSSNLSVIPGLKSFSSDRSIDDVTTTGMVKGGVYGVMGNNAADATGKTFAFGYALDADVATLNISGGVKGTPTITLSGTGLKSTVINTTGTVGNTTGAITALGQTVTVNAASDLTGTLTAAGATSLTITGSATVDFAGAALANGLVTVDASAMSSGGAKVVAGNGTGFKFTGGAGNDHVTTGSVLGATGLIDAGMGTSDRLIVTAATHVTAGNGKLYKNFEQLHVSATAADVSVDVDHLVGTNAIVAAIISQAGAFDATVDNLSATAAGNVSILRAAPTTAGTDIITIGVKGATLSGQRDTVKTTVSTTKADGTAQNIDLTGLTLAGVENLELTGNGNAAGTTGTVTFTTANALSLDNIKFANAGAGNTITVSAGQATNLVIDASASSGDVSVNANANNATTGVNVRGGSSFDVIKGSNGGSDVLSGGAGNDVLCTGTATVSAGTATAIGSASAATAATASDLMTGGTGRDMFVLGTNSALATMSTITDMDFGGLTLVAGVDGITADLATAGAALIVTLTTAQKSTIAAAANLAGAFDAVATVDTAVNATVLFDWGNDTYLFINGVAGGSAYSATNDLAVKLTGYMGTLDASDITIV